MSSVILEQSLNQHVPSGLISRGYVLILPTVMEGSWYGGSSYVTIVLFVWSSSVDTLLFFRIVLFSWYTINPIVLFIWYTINPIVLFIWCAAALIVLFIWYVSIQLFFSIDGAPTTPAWVHWSRDDNARSKCGFVHITNCKWSSVPSSSQSGIFAPADVSHPTAL